MRLELLNFAQQLAHCISPGGFESPASLGCLGIWTCVFHLCRAFFAHALPTLVIVRLKIWVGTLSLGYAKARKGRGSMWTISHSLWLTFSISGVHADYWGQSSQMALQRPGVTCSRGTACGASWSALDRQIALMPPDLCKQVKQLSRYEFAVYSWKVHKTITTNHAVLVRGARYHLAIFIYIYIFIMLWMIIRCISTELWLKISGNRSLTQRQRHGRWHDFPFFGLFLLSKRWNKIRK